MIMPSASIKIYQNNSLFNSHNEILLINAFQQ